MKNKRNFQQLHQISTATLLEESSHLKIVMQGVIAVGILILALVLWAAFATIKETAITVGEVIPKGQVQIVQHLEGGIVRKVLVTNGEEVKKGELLIEMDSNAVQAELSQLRSREISLTLNQERLSAFLAGKKPDLLQWSAAVINSKYNAVKNHKELSQLLSEEKDHLAAQYKSIDDQAEILKATLAKRKEELKETISQIAVQKKHFELLKQEFDMYESLKAKNYVSHRDYLVVLRDLNKAKGEGVRLVSEKEKAEDSIREAEYKLKELHSTAQKTAREELGTVSDNLMETRHKIEKLDDRLDRLQVKSPVTGIVKGLRVYAGNVVQPAGILLEVVPLSKIMLVESRVNPKDIGHIKVGDPVKVKLLTYDFARYGAIAGKLTRLSASTFEDKEGKPFYRATIALDQQYLGSGDKKKQLKPGMTVQADIITGEKTLLNYLLKPIHRARDAAFTER